MKQSKNIFLIISVLLLAAACSVKEDKSPAKTYEFSENWEFTPGSGDSAAVLWYRQTATLPKDFFESMTKKGGVILYIDSISGVDTLYINGVKSGSFSFQTMMQGGSFFKRNYFIPASAFKKGENAVAIRVFAPWPDNSPFAMRKGLLPGGKIALVTAETVDKLSLGYTVNDEDYIFLEPSPISITAKIENSNSWNVEGKFIVDITTDDYRQIKSDTLSIKSKAGKTDSLTFVFDNPEPGFYRYSLQFVRGEDVKLEKKFNVGFEPEKISSPIDAHGDFKEFWDKSLAELAKIKPNYKMKLIPEQSNDDYEMYLVEMQSLGNETIRGYYSKPKHEGKFPVIVEYMGYGSNAYFSSVKWDGFAHFVPSIRGQGLNRLTKEDDFWITIGCLGDKENYYYRGGFCDVVRALDFVCSRPEIDAEKLAVRGGSQGGALSMVAASLDKRVKVCAPNVPFLSDYRDYFKIVDWPRSDFDNFAKTHPDFNWKHVYDLLTYFDIKNLAQWIECPLWMAIGVQDATCPPHINFAAYNQVKSEKQWLASPTSGHSIADPAIWEKEQKFIREKLEIEAR
ncbi:MAG: acetylxylan esterase [Dysgonamonadaceae bacterium]|nr:acetylxylan esterase [Dysgonamonadaceae bacterium]